MEQRTSAASFRFVSKGLFNMWSTEDRFASPVLNLWFTGFPPPRFLLLAAVSCALSPLVIKRGKIIKKDCMQRMRPIVMSRPKGLGI
jgi:hypothetical protein